jgi:hypothetical protein
MSITLIIIIGVIAFGAIVVFFLASRSASHRKKSLNSNTETNNHYGSNSFYELNSYGLNSAVNSAVVNEDNNLNNRDSNLQHHHVSGLKDHHHNHSDSLNVHHPIGDLDNNSSNDSSDNTSDSGGGDSGGGDSGGGD